MLCLSEAQPWCWAVGQTLQYAGLEELRSLPQIAKRTPDAARQRLLISSFPKMKKPLERPRAGPILPRSDWSVLPSCAERWDGGEDRNTSLPGFDSPTDAVQENGTYGGRRQSRRISYFARRLSCFCSKKRLEGDRACAMLSLSGWWLD